MTGNGGLGGGRWSINKGLFHVNTCSPSFRIPSNPRTRLWSMISTIVASFPSDGPPWMRTIRPTSTSRQEDALISASPIVIDSTTDLLVDEVLCFLLSWQTHWAGLSICLLALKYLSTKIVGGINDVDLKRIMHVIGL